MATVTTAQLAAKLDSLTTAFQALVLQATTDNPPPRKVLVTDLWNREIEIEPDRIFQMVELNHQATPTTSIPATLCLFTAQDSGKLVSCYLPGKPSAVRAQIGGTAPVTVALAAPTAVVEQAQVTSGTRELDLAGMTIADSPLVTGAPNPNMVLIIKGWQSIGWDRSFWAARRGSDGSALIAEEHGSGFTVQATGYLGFKLEGDAAVTPTASLT